MMRFRQQLNKIKLIRFLSSVKLNVVCLSFLYILIFWGTLAQVQNGLYQAQHRFFESFFFLAFGFLPFPGAQLVMWVLFVNLICVALTRFAYSWRNIGIIIIHSGLLLFLVSGYMTLHGSNESFLHLKEGEASNLSTSYYDWEISIWESAPQNDPMMTDRQVTAVDFNDLKPGQIIPLHALNAALTVKEHYKNCTAHADDNHRTLLNASGITELKSAELIKEPEKNTPGIVLQLETTDREIVDVLLFGNDSGPLNLELNDKKYQMLLRLKRNPLPFTLKLIDFKKEEHPGTETARKFQSLVEIEIGKSKREKLISMNEPLRYKDFTFYQSSFSVDKIGNESSVLAVVQNGGRIMPYVSTGVTFLGLVIHFVMAGLRSRKTPLKEKSS